MFIIISLYLVLKFKRRTRFLEFVVQLVGKAIDEGQIEASLEWSNDAMTWIIRYCAIETLLNLFYVESG
jgi:hypothetical protein